MHETVISWVLWQVFETSFFLFSSNEKYWGIIFQILSSLPVHSENCPLENYSLEKLPPGKLWTRNLPEINCHPTTMEDYPISFNPHTQTQTHTTHTHTHTHTHTDTHKRKYKYKSIFRCTNKPTYIQMKLLSVKFSIGY